MTQAYIYIWKELNTRKWYLGSRSKQGCHPDDGYICSSIIVKPLIEANPSNWKREILEIGDPLVIRLMEAEYLTALDARNDPRSYNRSNGRPSGRMEQTPESNLKRSKSQTGVAKPAGHGANVSKANKGRKHKPETLEKFKKRVPWNKGKTGVQINPNKGKKFGKYSAERIAKQKAGIAKRKQENK